MKIPDSFPKIEHDELRIFGGVFQLSGAQLRILVVLTQVLIIRLWHSDPLPLFFCFLFVCLFVF